MLISNSQGRFFTKKRWLKCYPTYLFCDNNQEGIFIDHRGLGFLPDVLKQFLNFSLGTWGKTVGEPAQNIFAIHPVIGLMLQ